MPPPRRPRPPPRAGRRPGAGRHGHAAHRGRRAGPGHWAGLIPGRVADRDLAASNSLLPPQGIRPPDEDALDLLSVAGLPVLKRVLPAAGVALFGVVLFSLLRRRRRRARG